MKALITFLLLTIVFETSVASMDPRTAEGVFWTSCGIQKYCTTERTLSDEAYLEMQAEAIGVLVKENNLKTLSCNEIKSDLESYSSLVMLKVHIRSTTQLDETTCLSNVSLLKKIEIE